ncbi:hypothetical protein [Vogesella indigofera]|uniref:Uncharacterized protein n=1 Tax=Vogesella indigofera TaxID=45465 RepID=A0ABT5I2U4_VOGIN|nr:hypothetical protein [Vogesella indigofera]MDC7690485.1 hypothetical protein [Vogesella indigofera]
MIQHGRTLIYCLCMLPLAGGIARADSITSVQVQIDTLTQQYNSLQNQFNFIQQQLTAAQATITSLSNNASYQSHMLAALKDSTACIASESNSYTLIFRGCNVVIQNGKGSTITQNGLGNLIIGYNEDDTYENVHDGPNDRSGSHNLIVGPEHTYASFGGLVAGYGNFSRAPFSSILGGNKNNTTGMASTVAGGGSNTASSDYAAVGGGYYNQAGGNYSVISGGANNKASGVGSSVGGGLSRQAQFPYNWAAGELIENQ